jgi:hypothetical protein
MPGGPSGFLWSAFALIVLLWPAKVPGLFDGAPLDGGLEAVVVGLLVPALCWFHGAFFHSRVAKILVIGLGLARLADAQLTPGGWCVRFDPPRPAARTAGTSAPTGVRLIRRVQR